MTTDHQTELGDATDSPIFRAGLSMCGEARRAEILERLLHAQRHRRHRRAAGTFALAIAPIILIAAVAWVAADALHRHAPAQNNDRFAHQQSDATHPPEGTSESTIDPAWIIRVQSRAERISDSELLSLLAEAGKPDGLIRVHGRTMLASELTREAAADDNAPPRSRLDAPHDALGA